MIEDAAINIWQSENIRIMGRPRSINWDVDVMEFDKAKYRDLANAALQVIIDIRPEIESDDDKIIVRLAEWSVTISSDNLVVYSGIAPAERFVFESAGLHGAVDASSKRIASVAELRIPSQKGWGYSE